MPFLPPVITRFAPSPTGYLHLGHLVNAIYVWGVARALGGKVILRLEDHDRGRCRPEYEAAILNDLEWLGLTPDMGAVAQFRGGASAYRQSDNTSTYDKYLLALAGQGLIYTCTCSRKQVVARTGGGRGELRYDGHCRQRGYRPDEPGGVRVQLDAVPVALEDAALGALVQCPADQCGDLLVKDRHGNWTYQFAVTVDDWNQGVGLVIRGEDLVDSTARQVQLAKLLGRESAPLFLHHPLITDPGGNKLSKREFAKGLRDYRAEGWTPERLLGEAAQQVELLPAGNSLSAAALPELFAGRELVRIVQRRLDELKSQP